MPSRPYAIKNSPLQTVTSETHLSEFDSLLNDYLDYQRVNCAPKTIANSEHKVGKFIWWWSRYHSKKGLHPRHVSLSEAREFTLYLKSPIKQRWGVDEASLRPSKIVLSPASVASYGRAIKAFFNWLEDEKHIPYSPFNHKSVKFASSTKDENRVIKTIGVEQLRAVFTFLAKDTSFTGRRNLAFLAFLLDTGVRRGEALGLTIGDLDISHRARCVVRGKTGSREVYFSDRCRQLLLRYLSERDYLNAESDEPLWIGYTGEQMSENSISRLIRKILKETGVRVSPHRFRHTFATMMIAGGSDVFAVQNLLGHADVTTTQIYVNYNSEKLAAAQKASSPLSSLALEVKKRGRPRRR